MLTLRGEDEEVLKLPQIDLERIDKAIHKAKLAFLIYFNYAADALTFDSVKQGFPDLFFNCFASKLIKIFMNWKTSSLIIILLRGKIYK